MTARSGLASDPAASRGRLHRETSDGHRGPRDMFQRDRDRIIHSIAFRRLRHKTQVFIAPDGDHFRVRLTHSLEVAQIGRTIARALGLNEDLTEALCLAHDIGHPPFGHAGEDALQAAMADFGGFDHNAHTLRTLTRLETPYPLWDGLNLSWETLEGLAKHNGPITEPTWALADVDREFPLDLQNWPSLEAQVAAIADDIAYDNHDIDDGLRAGLLTLDQCLSLEAVKDRWDSVCRRFPGVPQDRLIAELIRDQIGVMVNDVIAEIRRMMDDLRIETAADVRGAGQRLGRFSDSMAAEERLLKRFMYDNLYNHPAQTGEAERASIIVSELMTAFAADPNLLPAEWMQALPTDDPERQRHIADFLAGMTDRYAITMHARICGGAA